MIKALLWGFAKYLGRFHMLTAKPCSETLLFVEFSNKDFHTLYFQKYIGYDDELFFQNVENLIYNPEMEQKIQKMFFVSQIIAFELGVANSLNLEQDTCHRHSMC